MARSTLRLKNKHITETYSFSIVGYERWYTAGITGQNKKRSKKKGMKQRRLALNYLPAAAEYSPYRELDTLTVYGTMTGNSSSAFSDVVMHFIVNPAPPQSTIKTVPQMGTILASGGCLTAHVTIPIAGDHPLVTLAAVKSDKAMTLETSRFENGMATLFGYTFRTRVDNLD
jgi:hypothetical protein